jgi:hypothetical protein
MRLDKLVNGTERKSRDGKRKRRGQGRGKSAAKGRATFEKQCETLEDKARPSRGTAASVCSFSVAAAQARRA